MTKQGAIDNIVAILESMNQPSKIPQYLLGLSFIVFVAGVWAQLVRLPFAEDLITAGAMASVILLLVRLAFKRERRITEYLKYLAFILFLISRVMIVNHLPFSQPIAIASIVVLVVWILWTLMAGESADLIVRSTVLKISVVLLIIGYFFKITHWPGSFLLLSLGALGLVVFIIDYFVLNDRA